VRYVDSFLQRGCPHLKFGKRRVRFDLDEVAAWVSERFGQRRLGPLQPDKTGRSAAGVAKREGQP
jgi:hypothetical protein